MKFDTLYEINSEISDQIENQLEAKGYDVSSTISNLSLSAYVRVTRPDPEDEDDEEEIQIRISDHGAKHQRSVSDFTIGIDYDFADINVRVAKTFEKWVEDGPIECDENDDDAEHCGYEVYDDYIADAVEAATKFVENKWSLENA